MSSYETSNSLIESVKNRAMIPTNQQTFTVDNFLRFANEEMMMGILPLVEQFHEEFFIFEEAFQINPNQTAYEIPSRATGNKLRSLYLLDSQQNRFPMTRISSDDLEYYNGGGYGQNIGAFYVANNTVNLLSAVGSDNSSKLLFSYYFRPNKLVKEERVARVQAVSPTASLAFATTDVSVGTDVITITAHNLASGMSVTFSSSGTLPSPLSAGSQYYIETPSISTIKVYLDKELTQLVDITNVGSGSHSLLPNSYDVSFQSTLPTVFNAQATYDILQTKSPHKTLRYDLVPVAVTTTFIRFKKEDMRRSMDDLNATPVYILPKKDDIVALAGETIIPQIPDELHSMLAQRVACRCLEALGDQQGLQAANLKLAEMEAKSATLINDRIESSPQKVVNRNSPLRRKGIGPRFGR